MNNITLLLENSTGGMEPDCPRALERLTEDSSKGDASPMNSLGSLLKREAVGVEKDAVHALQLYRKLLM